MTQAYPLQWPEGTPRTKARRPGQFKVSFAKARDSLMFALDAIGARLPVLSTNVELRLDGMPRAGMRNPDDPGVAVYFQDRHRRQLVLACDKWLLVEHNIRAIALTIEAMRGMDRWGVAQASDRVFTGFAALPPPGDPHWTIVLGLDPTANAGQVQEAWKRLVRERPETDRQRFNVARDQALREIGA